MLYYSIITSQLLTFVPFARETGRKIEDVCRRFNLQRRFLTKDFCRTEDINYGQVADQIEQEIKKSEEFIRESFLPRSKAEYYLN